MSQQLTGKESTLFRTLVKLYEGKQYKKALKTADQILKKVPDHADTLAMKALTFNAQGHTDDAFSLAKIALQKNMKSPVCWHVYGLLYRSAKNLEEAIKAYKFALKLDPDSQQIQRDLAFLQIQMRDYQGYIQTRNDILQARPAIRANWSSLAVAYHVAGDLEEAEKTLKTFEDTLKRAPPKSDHEHSEAILYRNDIIAESGDYERALEHLNSIFRANLDRTAVMEKRAQYLLKLDRKEEAETAYRALLDRNSEYRPYYQGLEQCLGLSHSTPEDATKLSEMYASYAEKNARLDAPRRIPLDYLTGEDFKNAAAEYLRRKLTKGVPSTFSNIKALYRDPAKLQAVHDIVENLKPEDDAEGDQVNGDSSSKFAQARLYFLAQHYNYHLSRDLGKATTAIEEAIKLNPKSVEFQMTRARILKHAGNTQEAARVMNAARESDLKDRYINTKCAKYQLRNNDNDEALRTMSLFTRNETVGGALGDLHDMQCMWFLTEDGEANLRQGKIGLALKRFKAIYDIFDVWQEDQFDFHHFSFRKGQIRAYVEMLRWEDRLRDHPFYYRAALKAVKTYILLHDEPSYASNGIPNLDGLDAKERKKALLKAKREQEKAEKAEQERIAAERKNAPKPKPAADGEQKKEDPDPQGTQLLATKTPLDDAVKFLAPILEFSPGNIEGQNAGFEVYIRRNKYLLALKCLRAAHHIDPEDAVLHEQIVRFRLELDGQSEQPTEKIASVLDPISTGIIPPKSTLKAYNDSFLIKHPDSPRHIFSGLKARVLLDPGSKAASEKEIIATVGAKASTIETTTEGLEVLRKWKSEGKVVEEYEGKARERWPDAVVFKRE